VGFPVKETWIRATRNGHYKSWPGITAEIVSKHFLEAIEAQKGHMKKQHQNICSTKQPQPVSKEEELEKASATHNIMVKVINANNTIYTDQTSRLPIQSSHGNKHSWFCLMLMQITLMLNPCKIAGTPH
jgi:hypothetical protein